MVSVLKSRPAYWYIIKFTIVLSIIGIIFLFKSPLSFFQGYKGDKSSTLNTERLRNTNYARGSIKRKSLLSVLSKKSLQLKKNWFPSIKESQKLQYITNHTSIPSFYLNSISLDHDEITSVFPVHDKIYNDDDSNDGDIVYGDDDEDDGNTPICHKLPFYPGDKCAFAKGNCMNPLAGGTLNYLQMRYCLFPNSILFFIFIAFWVLMLFFLLGNTAESNFCPSLTEISDLLRLSPDVSGVTLLAFGNGAPDIASIMAGAFTGSSGFVLGEPIGSGLFITTGVFAFVTLLSNVKVEKVPFIRDVGTCLIGILFCFVVYLNGSFELWHSLTCLGIYFIYVFFVIIGKQVYYLARRIKRKLLEKKKGTEKENLLSINNTIEDVSYSGNFSPSIRGHWKSGKAPLWRQETSRVSLLDDNVVDFFRSDQQVFASHYFPKVGIVYQTTNNSKTQVISPKSISHNDILMKNENSSQSDESLDEVEKPKGSLVIEDHFAPTERIPTDDDDPDRRLLIVKLFNDLINWIQWREMSTKDRLFYILMSPTILARNLTIPIATKEDWSKFFAVLNPIFIPWFLLWVIGYYDFLIGPVPLGLILTLIGCVFSVFIYLTSNRRKAPIYHPILVIISFFMGISWIYVTANELVAVLQSIGILFQVSDAILAATVLTWGNSLGDMVADVVVSRNGFPEMACSAIFGGPTMNLLIGVGLSVSYHCISQGEGFEMQPSPTVLLTFILVILSLVGSLVLVPLMGFTSPKLYGFVLLMLYFFFMAVAVSMEIGVLFPFVKI